MRRLLGLIIFGAMLVSADSAWAAGKDKDLGAFGDWHAYAYEEGGQTVCYMATTKTPSAASKRKTPSYLMVTHRPIEGSTDVFSYGAGVELDSKHGAQLTLGKDTFDLFSVKDTAWAREALTDHKIAKALRNNSAARIFAMSAKGRGVAVKESFSLAGAADAYRVIGKACSLPDMDVKPPAKKAPVIKQAAKMAGPKSAVKAPNKSKTAARAAPTKKAAPAKTAAKSGTGSPKVKSAPAKKAVKTPQ